MRFDETRLASLRSVADHVVLDATQDAMIRELTSLVAPRLGIDPIPCRGAWLSAVRRWQERHGAVASTVSATTPEARLRAAVEIREQFRAIVREMLIDSSKLSEIDRALDAAFDLYVAKYQKRPKT